MRSMTSVERLLAATRGEPIDRVANSPLIKQFCTRQLGIPYRGYNRDHRVLVESQLAMHDRWPIDCFTVMGYAYREAGDCGLPLFWPEDTVPHPTDILVKERSDIQKLSWPDPWEGPFMRDRLQGIQLFKKCRPEVAVIGAIEGCFAQAVTFRGMENAMIDLMEDRDLLRELMDFILFHELAFAKAQVEAGADLIFVGDSAASLVGHKPYLEVILPYEQAMTQAIRGMAVPSKLHICGDISHLLPSLVSVGADIIDIDWMVDLGHARHMLGPEVCLCGNFDPVAVLLQSTPERVREECLRCIREGGTPFILAPGCEVPPDTPPPNFAALCQSYQPWD